MQLQGRISISRPHTSEPSQPYNDRGDAIHVRVHDASTSLAFLDLSMSLEDFAYALTGLSNQPCTLELRGLQHLGKRREVKQERVPYTPVYGDGALHAKRQALAPFEVDGWEGEPGDLGNQHRGNSQDGYRVTFVRYVATGATPP